MCIFLNSLEILVTEINMQRVPQVMMAQIFHRLSVENDSQNFQGVFLLCLKDSRKT